MLQQPHLNRHKQKNNTGWTTIEMLYSFPILIAAMMMTLYFGMLVHAKLRLSNATNAAVQALAKTKDCDIASSYFSENFPYSNANLTCNAGDEISEYTAKYTFKAFPIIEVVIPSTELFSTSKAITEKQD